MRAPTLGLLAAALCLAALLAPSADGAGGHRPPKVIQLSYDESSGDIGPDRQLEAFSRRTDSLGFVTSFNGHRGSAPGKYRSDITDTDLHGGEARHPWIPDRDHGGRRVIRLVHRALSKRGFAKVTVRARNGAGVDVARVRIDRSSDCTSDPPLYPLTCEVRVR